MEFDDDSLKRAIEIEKASCDIEISPKYSQEHIENQVINWLNDNPVRSLSSLEEFTNLVAELFEIKVRENGRDKILQLAMQNSQSFLQGMKRNREFFNELIKKYEEDIDKKYDSAQQENIDELLLIDISNTIGEIIEGLKNVLEISNKFIFDRKSRRKTPVFVSKLFNFFDSIILLSLRWLEIVANKDSPKLKLSHELLEWDLNTFHGTIYEIKKLAKRIDEEEKSDEKEKSIKLAKILVQMMG